MIKKIKQGIIPIFLAVICGSICGKLLCDIYINDASKKMDVKKIYLVQSGAYSTYDNMIKNTNVASYVYYEDDDGLYKTIIGITKDYDNLEKIKNTYSGDIIVSEYYSNDHNLNTKLEKYDKEIKDTEDENEIKEIVIEMLNIYKDEEDNTLIKIS